MGRRAWGEEDSEAKGHAGRLWPWPGYAGGRQGGRTCCRAAREEPPRAQVQGLLCILAQVGAPIGRNMKAPQPPKAPPSCGESSENRLKTYLGAIGGRSFSDSEARKGLTLIRDTENNPGCRCAPFAVPDALSAPQPTTQKW